LLFAPAVAFGSPFLLADLPDQTTTHCGFQLDGAARVELPVGTHSSAGPVKVCVMDLAKLAAGNHVANVTAIRVGLKASDRVESNPSGDLAFPIAAPPVAPAVPTNPRVTK